MTAVALCALLAGNSVTAPFMDRCDEYAIYIDRCAVKYRIHHTQVISVIWIESSGDPNAYNEDSMATGLMGVIPQEAGPLFADRETKEELFIPSVNINRGCAILAGNMKRHPASFKESLFWYAGYGTRDNVVAAVGEFEEEYWNRFSDYSLALFEIIWSQHAEIAKTKEVQ